MANGEWRMALPPDLTGALTDARKISGLTNSQRGVVAAASYEARAYGWHDDGRRTIPQGDGHGLRRMTPVRPGLVRSRRHDAARPIPTDKHRLAAKLRPVELLD